MADRLKVLMYYLYYKYRRPFADRQALEKWQERKLRKHLEYVAEHSRLYKGKTKQEDYPIIDKAFMMEHFDALNTVGIGREEAETFAVQAERERDFAPKLKGVTVGLSSGTSGRQGIFLVSDGEKNRWAGYILAKFLPGSILDSLDIAFFMRADSNLYQAVSSKNIRFHFFDIYRDMAEHKARLEETKPVILAGQPSLLLMLAKEMERGTLGITPRIVISIAEVLEREDEAYLKRAFRLEVIHQVYQCTEGCLASTCACGTLHLNEDIVRIEREYLDGNRFIPIVTDFERKAQPIIRYRLNDILVEKKSPCGCGSPFLALEKIEGREDDMFSFLDGKGQEKMVFPDFIRRCVLFAGDRAEEGTVGKPVERAMEEPMKKTEEASLKRPAEKAEGERGRNLTEYRIVQKQDRSIIVYADFDAKEKKQVLAEFGQLAKDRDFVLPEIRFAPYFREKGKKMKRVERASEG
nr:F390 synthetase-related protein [uncultured Acetatifactor sp.]